MKKSLPKEGFKMIRRLWQLFAMGHTFGHACGVRVQKVQSPMVRLQVKF